MLKPFPKRRAFFILRCLALTKAYYDFAEDQL